MGVTSWSNNLAQSDSTDLIVACTFYYGVFSTAGSSHWASKSNLDKIDLQRLKGDVKEYEISGALSRDACAYWKSFLGNFYKNRE